ncbi:hypothetical protein CC86DRAFT_7484 [Ophiobolus disseminans]|uniref:Galactose oxidase n=1 Tax=Ophiobolus disseminans TaxID=1469910 RepID=A0A6A7AIY7_9PLEO|nr:hypothetical protein CC86DRAFT_7484 [Ophiobolus disseminans]
MGYSEPKYPLNGHCSVVHDGTLYVYSSAGFQSLKLQEGAEWQAMPMDISLTGASCVNAGASGKMYVVGGAANATGAAWNYPGLMHYTFANKKWDWQRSQSWNTQNRQSHAAVYLEQSKKLLVYSGSQKTGDIGPSSETFLISTVEPYNVQSMPSAGAPPSVRPMLMSMDKDSALLVGGGAANTAIWKFSEAAGWQDMGVALQAPIVNPEAVQCTVVSGKGKSRVLEKFDMSVAPNKVDRILLVKEDGSPAAAGATPGKTKRVTVEEWPTYNATYAPTSARSGYSLAQGTDGLTVASGGNQTDPIALFNAKENSWVNATALFAGQQVISNSESSSTISSQTRPTATPISSTIPSSTPTADVVAPPAAAPSNKGKMLTVLGATLGTIFGIAAILIMILLFLKYRKNKSKQSQGYVEKDRMSFADRGADFMKEAGGSVVAHHYGAGNDSTTSLAIIQGRGATGHKKNMASDASQAGLVKKTSPLGYSDPVELSKFDLKPEPIPEGMVRQNSNRAPAVAKANPRARSSGWSRYFANNEPTNLANQPDRSTYASDRTSTGSRSNYTNSRMYNQRRSQQIAPLEIPKFDGQRLSRVASGSPTLGSSIVTLPHQVQPMQAEMGRANSTGSSRSGVSHMDDYARQPAENWTPVGNENRASSTYTGSMVFDTNGNKHDGTSSYYPDANDSFYPKSNFSSFYPGQGDSPRIPDMRDSTHTMFPSGNAASAPLNDMPKSKFSSMYPTPPPLGLPQDRASTVTVFPGPNAPKAGLDTFSNDHPSSFYPPPRVGHDSTVTMFPGPGGAPDKSKNGQSDMSWLNLGSTR